MLVLQLFNVLSDQLCNTISSESHFKLFNVMVSSDLSTVISINKQCA